jgi:hypothetical protein
MKNRDLTQLLRDWAARHEPDPIRMQDLTANALRAASGPPLAREAAGVADGPAPRWWPHLVSGLAGAAAACLVMALFGHGREPAPVAAAAPAAEAALPELSAPGQAEAILVYRPIDELFSGQLLWLVESDKDIRLGLPDDGAPSSQPGGLVVVRTVVLTRRGSDTAWRRVWEVTAAARAEQPVDTTLENARFTLWTYPLPDGGVVVDSALELRHPVTLNINASNIFLSAKPIRILSMQTETAEYQVLQMVRQVATEQGGA